ncbi:MAG: DMT family transporter [Firmicutes bacterium]|nr:DMT family transporter [Bacillota bacterium]
MENKTIMSLVLTGGVLAISCAAILIRLAEAAPPVIAFYRMAFSTLMLAPAAWIELRRSSLTKRQVGLMAVAGVFLALHFLLWMTSLEYTSVTSSVVLVTTQPLFVSIFSALILKEVPPRQVWYGLGLAIAGSAVIAFGQGGGGESRLLGNMMALGGAVMAASYFLVGRVVRRDVSLAAYSAVVYGFSAAVLGLFVLIQGLPLTGYPSSTWWSLFLLALFPTVIGHTALNWALKYLPTPLVSVSILGEPLGASVLAYFILQEIPAWGELAGGILILAGILLVWLVNEKG